MEDQLAQLTRAIWTIGIIMAVFFGAIFFLASSVVLAEFVRRERTETKEDDWIEWRRRD